MKGETWELEYGSSGTVWSVYVYPLVRFCVLLRYMFK